jgi:hypothetical protein
MTDPKEGRELTDAEKREITRDLIDVFKDSVNGTDKEG